MQSSMELDYTGQSKAESSERTEGAAEKCCNMSDSNSVFCFFSFALTDCGYFHVAYHSMEHTICPKHCLFRH